MPKSLSESKSVAEVKERADRVRREVETGRKAPPAVDEEAVRAGAAMRAIMGGRR